MAPWFAVRQRSALGLARVEQLLDALVRNAKEFACVSSTQSETRKGLDRFKCLLLRLRSGSLCFVARTGDSNGHCGNARWVLVMDVEGVFIAVEPQRQRFANAFVCLAEAAAVRLTATETFDRDSPNVALVAFVNGGVSHVNQPFPRQLSRERSIDRRVPAGMSCPWWMAITVWQPPGQRTMTCEPRWRMRSQPSRSTIRSSDRPVMCLAY